MQTVMFSNIDNIEIPLRLTMILIDVLVMSPKAIALLLICNRLPKNSFAGTAVTTKLDVKNTLVPSPNTEGFVLNSLLMVNMTMPRVIQPPLDLVSFFVADQTLLEDGAASTHVRSVGDPCG